jgi:hypothetical protein
VTEAQVSMADGYVRCGVCKEVFNAYEVADNAALEAENQPSLLDASPLDNRENILSDDTQAAQVADEDHESIDTTETDFSEDVDNKIDDEITEAASATPKTDFNDTDATAPSRKDAFDFFDEEANQPLEHVVPDRLRNDHLSASSSVIATLMRSIAILLVTAGLMIQYVWFNRDRFSQVPEVQALTDELCKQFKCEGIELRAPEKIELISRNVYSHPNEKDALMVNITMKNTAEFAQPYPVLQIDFSDIRGGKVAARRFKPAEYMPDIASVGGQHLTLPPGTAIDITLEISDPGTDAMTYEFNFL